MTNKPFIVLGVVTALALAGGEAHAAMPCANTSVGTIQFTPGGFNCTDGNLTFSDFSFTAPEFIGFGRGTSVAFTPDSVTFRGLLAGTSTFDYRVTTIAGDIVRGTLDQTIETAGGHMSTSTTMNGLTLAVSGNESRSGTISPASTTVMVANSASGGGPIGSPIITGSLTNTFSVSEPMSLSLFGLGLAGLALARRRRSSGRKRSN